MSPRLVVLGLDCASPRLVFELLRDELPNLRALSDRGRHGTLRSVSPPITVPAWACMTTGLDPGELGLYGFHVHEEPPLASRLARSTDVRAPHVWDRLGAAGHTVAALFVPPSTPPRGVRGVSAACFLSPPGAPWTFPESLGSTLEEELGPYPADVEAFRDRPVEDVLAALERMVDHHFDVAERVLARHEPDFLMLVEIATDRLHHVAYAHLDPSHPAHVPTSPLVDRARGVYRRLDARVGALVRAMPPTTTFLIVSDHGARPLEGAFCVNDWLIERGFLHLARPLARGARLQLADVDWTRTRAYGEGGYAGRVHLVRNGERIDPRDDDATLAAIEVGLTGLRDHRERSVSFRVERPHRTYRRVRGRAPALQLYPGDLAYRVVGTVGHPALFLPTDDRGPDACNHDWEGLFVAAGDGVIPSAARQRASLLDVAPTIAARFGLPSEGRNLFVD